MDLDGEKVVEIANALDMLLRARGDKLDNALVGSLVFVGAFLESLENATARDGVPMPTELLTARAAISDFIRQSGLEIEHDL